MDWADILSKSGFSISWANNCSGGEYFRFKEQLYIYTVFSLEGQDARHGIGYFFFSIFLKAIAD